jgi:transposase
MYLKACKRRKNGKEHRYFSVVESRRLPGGKVFQRQVLYLGEINDSQQAAWRKTLLVVGERGQDPVAMSLFPDDRPLPPDAVDAVQVRMNEMVLRRPRAFGDCWLGCELWRQLQLDGFWNKRLPEGKEQIPWAKVLELLVVNRLIDPGSEFRVHRHWFAQTAMDQLLGVDESVAAKDRLYRCLDRLLEHKDELFRHLQSRWKDLFAADFDVLLYDLTSTYFEGLCQDNPKAGHGYSRDGRGDCRQVVIALVVTPQGLPLAYEVMPGNTSDRATPRTFLDKIQSLYGKARRTWVMDRGIPSEDLLAQMRADGVDYLVGTPRGQLSKLEALLAGLPWQKVRDDVQVKLLPKDGEVYVLAKSNSRRQKEHAMRRRRLRGMWDGLVKLRQRCPSRDDLLKGVTLLSHDAGRAAALVEVHLPPEGQAVTRESFRFALRKDAFRAAWRRDGAYILRGTLRESDPAVLWQRYMLLTEIEATFKCLKSELAIRPVHHQLEHRVEAHILVAFLGYCLMTTLKLQLAPHAPGLTPRSALEKLCAIQMVDVCLPVVQAADQAIGTPDGDTDPTNRWLVMPRHTQPEPEQQIILDLLAMSLPAQPPPRITGRDIGGQNLPPRQPTLPL